MKNRKLLLVVSLILALTVSLGGTLAYLTDTDSDVNVMTLGNVEIEQLEQQLAADGTTLEPFVQGKDFYPGTVLSKIVSVENTGKSDAYFRTLIAFEDVPGSTTFGVSPAFEDRYYKWNLLNPVTITLNGSTYVVYEAVYNKALEAGQTSPASMTKVELDTTATNQDMADLGGTYEILVLSQACQTVNMPTDPVEALNTAFGLTADKAQAWFEEVYSNGGLPTTVVETADEFAAALANGSNVILNSDITVTETVNITSPANIDLNGKTLTVSILEAKADTTISNGTLNHGKSTYPAVSVSAGTLKLDDVDVVCNEYCHLQTSGTLELSEYSGIQVWGGKLVLNESTITVSTDKIRYGNTIFGIGIHGGEVIMNGGKITINNHGSHQAKYDWEAPIFAGSDTEKKVTLMDVEISTSSPRAKYLFAWGGHTILETTDTVTADDVDARHGNTYDIVKLP